MTRKLFYLRLLMYSFVLGRQDREVEWQRVRTYCTVGVIPFAYNLSTLTYLIALFDLTPAIANAYAVFVGGQVSFWTHDRITFKDRFPTIDGWETRWERFMPGQVAGLCVNSTVSWTLLATGLPIYLVYLPALGAGILTTYCWNNEFSHRERDEPIILPTLKPLTCRV